ncbi:glycine cleavage system T protein [Batrachochytrium salamandrivorans]|nr:glycine cleavage system T protein [Batrachochytrium salamandrivorans]
MIASMPSLAAMQGLSKRVLGTTVQAQRSRSMASTPGQQQFLRTSLYDFHVKNGGKMVEFAGWDMPVQYSGLGVLASHQWTRTNASIFDVSHMLQTRWSGKDHTKFIESLVVADVAGLPLGSSTLSVFTNEKGGIIDDTVINRQDDKGLYVVSNAGCTEKDLAHIYKHLADFQNKGGDVDVKVLDHVSLIAFQGPKAANIIASMTSEDISKFGFMTSRHMQIAGIDVYASRCGYTGEDGFEISVAHGDAVKLTQKLLDHPDVELAGLEGGLTWTIGKRRRAEGGFLGADKILSQLKTTAKGTLQLDVANRRVGLLINGAPAREHAEIFDKVDGTCIGAVTSGCPSPTMKKNIAMGYVQTGFHKVGTEVQVKVRQRFQSAVISKMPFVPHQYFRG